MHVLLVCMPCVELTRPNLALGLLKAILCREGLDVGVEYANLRMAQRLGLVAYQGLMNASRLWSHTGLGDWIFSPALFPGREPDHDAVFRLLTTYTSEPALHRERVIAELRNLTTTASALIEDLADEIASRRPAIVGCTSTFEQHVASLALLQAVRRREPAILTMLGGANCELAMGRATHRCFPFVDFVVSGEADGLIAGLVTQMLNHGRDVGLMAPGVLGPRHRRLGYLEPPSRAVFSALDELPYPDFSDYFSQLESTRLHDAVRPGLSLELSRGCWWGERQHCTFCGLNGEGMGYRGKSAERAVAELTSLSENWKIDSVELADNILDIRYFESVLPRLPGHHNIFLETKSNLKRSQVAELARAGARWVQPGIESLDSRVLHLMRKGAQAFHQIQFLKWAREYGIHLSWNMLWGFPGEEDGWYAEMARLVPLLEHLQPPGGLTPIRFDRFSPYFEKASDYGLTLTPNALQRLTYPFDADVVADLSYHFEPVTGLGYIPPGRPGLAAVVTAARAWQESFARAPCRLTWDERSRRVVDSRACATRSEHLLDTRESAVLAACDTAQAPGDLEHTLGADAIDVARRLMDERLLVALDGRYLSLPVSHQSPDPPVRPLFPGGEVLLAQSRHTIEATRVAPRPNAGVR